MNSEADLVFTMEDMLRARRAAQPPKVTHTEWEPVFGPERKRMVATRWSLFTVQEYTEISDRPLTGYERRHYETWWTEDGRQMGRWLPESASKRDVDRDGFPLCTSDRQSEPPNRA